MAKNRHAEADPHEPSSSDDEENIDQDDSETDSESEPEQRFAVKPSAPKKHDTHSKRVAGSLSSSEDDSGSDSDTPPRRPDRSLKSINSEAKEDPQKSSKKPRSKPAPASPPPPPKPSAAAKRSVDGDTNGDRASKKPKKKEADVGVAADATPKKDGEDSKKQNLFQRLFSEEDEVVLLEGLIEFKAKKGLDPIADMAAFYDFIKNKKSLHVDVSKGQISEKVRRFKKKFENNIAKFNNGKLRKFSNPHEQKAFELSKKIWSVEANGGAGVDIPKVDDCKSSKKNPIQKAKSDGVASPIQTKAEEIQTKVVTVTEVAPDAAGVALPVVSFCGRKTVEELILEDGLEIVDGAKKMELQEKWKQLKVEEIKLYMKRMSLIQEQAELVLKALEGPGH